MLVLLLGTTPPPSPGVPVIGYLCGTSAATCNGEKWLTFMGDPSEGSPTPFTLRYHFQNSTAPQNSTNITAYNTTMLHCSDKDPYHGNVSCGCADCPATCPALPTHPPVYDPRVWGIRRDAFITLCVIPVWVVLCVLVIMVLYTYHCVRLQKRNSYELVGEEDNKESSQVVDYLILILCCPFSGVDWLGFHFERLLKKLFQYWGLFAAKCWFIVIPCGVVVCIGLSIGLTMFQITTNPVELWSAPDSRARVEKDYFDSHFGPFYRTEQVIITTNMSYVNYSIVTASGQNIHKTIGPVFNKEVLLDVSMYSLWGGGRGVWWRRGSVVGGRGVWWGEGECL